MEHQENHTADSQPLFQHVQSPVDSQADRDDGNAYLYILIVMSFYAVFVCGIMLGYFRSKRKEKRRINVFTRLVHEMEQREWGAVPTKKHSLSSPAAVSGLSLPFCGNHGNPFGHPRFDGPLACALCTEQSSVSSLCSSADTRVTIEEEAGGSAGEEQQEERGALPDPSGDDSG